MRLFSSLAWTLVERSLDDLGTRGLAATVDDQCSSGLRLRRRHVAEPDVGAYGRPHRAAGDDSDRLTRRILNGIAVTRDPALLHDEADQAALHAFGPLAS